MPIEKCEKCEADISRLIDLGYTVKSGFKPLCVSCLFPGRIRVEWDDIETFFAKDPDTKIYLYGQKDGKPYLFGPHGVHDARTHQLLNIKMNRSFYNNKDAMIMDFDMELIELDKKKKAIYEKLCYFFGISVGDDPLLSIKQALHEKTECGAWINIVPETTFGDVEVGSIVKGVNFETTPVFLTWPFGTEEFIQAVKETETQVKYIWKETHGCKDCGESACYPGYNAINKKCKTCKGEGGNL